MGKVGIILGTGWSDIPLGGADFVTVKRVHMNEDPEGMRRQVEGLIGQGCKTLILTAAVGSLRVNVMPGDIVLVDGFVSVFAPDMPLRPGEFVSPDDIIDMKVLRRIAMFGPTEFKYWIGGHAMVRGPQFEGRKYDKAFIRQSGAEVVGMSIYPEACVAALHPGVRVVPICFVTNSATEDHSHGENQRRVKEVSPLLRELLLKTIEIL